MNSESARFPAKQKTLGGEPLICGESLTMPPTLLCFLTLQARSPLGIYLLSPNIWKKRMIDSIPR